MYPFCVGLFKFYITSKLYYGLHEIQTINPAKHKNNILHKQNIYVFLRGIVK